MHTALLFKRWRPISRMIERDNNRNAGLFTILLKPDANVEETLEIRLRPARKKNKVIGLLGERACP